MKECDKNVDIIERYHPCSWSSYDFFLRSRGSMLNVVLPVAAKIVSYNMALPARI